MRAKDIIGLIIALLFALGIAVLSRMFLMDDGPAKKAPEVKTVVQKAKTLDVLIATKPLRVGTSLARTDVRWQPWPETSINAAYITKGEANIKDMEGGVVRYPLSQGEPLTLEDIVRPGDRSFLSAIIDSGRRALSINVNPATSSSGLVRPGDFVDVILSKSEAGSDGLSNVISSEVVVSNVRVLAMDKQMGVEAKSVKKVTGGSPKTATLELTPGQAETLVRATQQGELFLSLHSISADSKDEKCPGGVCEEEPSSTYSIKVIRGDKTENITVKAVDEKAAGGKS